jgi:hypothetical protein
MSIFPENYKSATEDSDPKTSKYFKLGRLESGEETNLRLCGTFTSNHALCGWVYFTEEGKPKRSPEYPKNYLDDVGLSWEGKNKGTGEKGKPSFFLNWVCLRKEAEGFQILDISQKSVREALEAVLAREEDYQIPDGEMANFFLSIKREGKGLETTYTVVPTLKAASPADKKAWAGARDMIYLPSLYAGGDPFEGPPAEGQPAQSGPPLTHRDEKGADTELMSSGASGWD